ncbi:MAG: HAMP domain-containing protein [Streptosporangiales bacterium]|nr:HAMP domain-containing protein [Streptosporangiales bacterium]
MSERLAAAVRGWLPTPSTWPLRVKLVAAVLLLVSVGLAVASGATVAALRTYLYAKVDDSLLATQRQMTEAAQQGTWGRPTTSGLQLPSQYVVTVFPATGADRRVFGATFYPDEPDIPSIDISRAHRLHGKAFTVRSVEGEGRWRVAVSPLADGSGSIALAVSLATTDQTIGRLAGTLLVVDAAVLALIGALGYVLVRGSLRPLVSVESTAGAIAAGDLTRRVPESDPRTEIGRLSTALNTMLSQIEEAFRDREASEAAARNSEGRMRQFVADASHELRTPLTSIRGFSELYRQGAAGTREDTDRLMHRIEDESTRMGLLVDDLLLLARLDQRRPMARDPVDLVELAADAVDAGRAIQPDRDITLTVEDPDGAIVVGDEARLRQVLTNLVNNALTHTTIDVPVVVRIGDDPDDGGRVRLDVTDAGTGLSADDARRVFERFYRVDTSRSRSAGGTGLGLSIVSAIVAGHGGWAGVESSPGNGATFHVHLPRDLPPTAEPEEAVS